MRQVKHNVEESARNGAIVGKVSISGNDPTQVVVVALLQTDSALHAINYTHLNSTGRFALRVDVPGTYLVAAFHDKNGDLLPDQDELLSLYSGNALFREGIRTVSVEFSLTNRERIPERFRQALTSLSGLERKPLTIAIGEIANLADPKFSTENGEKGLWQFFDSMINEGIGVYFLEPYDAHKTPVLFINGAGGSPQDWNYFFSNLDRNKYQAWFYHYPTGARLEGSAETLHKIVSRLHEQYGFKRLYVTSHSMGGLVARSFINKVTYGDKLDFIKLFISISTPWNGHSAALYGVKYAPTTIPSWIDMVPESEYQKNLFTRALGENVDYFLLFGYHGKTALLRESNDGIVTLSSMLNPLAQQEAKNIYGFNEDHVSILSSFEAFEVYRKILEQTDKKQLKLFPYFYP